MKIKTSELQEGPALNWAVTILVWKADGYTNFVLDPKKFLDMHILGGPLNYDYSTWWAQGGPIIERYGIELNRNAGEWVATLVTGGVSVSEEQGPTPLVAAMRCYVASQLGDEIDVPDELLEENADEMD